MLKFPSKISKRPNQDVYRKQHSIFVSVYSSSPSSIFVYVFELFPSDSLGGTFFHQGDFEVRKVELIQMCCVGVHR